MKSCYRLVTVLCTLGALVALTHADTGNMAPVEKASVVKMTTDVHGTGIAGSGSIETGSCPCSGGTPEGEPNCGLPDTVNGGCNSTPPVFGTVAMNQIICGTGAFDGSTRDTDWYDYNHAGGQLTITCRAEFPVQINLLTNVCPPTTITFNLAPACTDALINTVQPAGAYRIFVGPQFATAFACNSGSNDYRLALTNIAPPGPPNDNCASATVATDGLTAFTTVGATTDGPASCGAIGNDVWFRYTATTTGSTPIETCSLASFDTVLAAYQGCTCAPLGAEMACNDDTCGLQSRITISTTAGQCYLIRVGGYNGATGAGQIRIGTAAAPPNNNCANAATANVGANNFTTVGATTDGPAEPGMCLFFGDDQISNDVWFRFTATTTGEHVIDTCTSTTYDSELGLYPNTCPTAGGTVLACNDDSCGLQSSMTYSMTAGTSYLIRIGGYAGATGSGVLTISLNVPCNPVNCPAGGVQEGEQCGADTNGGCNSTPPAFGTIACGQTICGTIWADANTRDTDWYTLTITTTTTVTATLSTENGAAVSFLLTGVCPPAILQTGNAPRCGSGSWTAANLAPGTYYVFAATSAFTGDPCDGTNNDYSLALACSGGPVGCNGCAHPLTCPGDVDGDGDVDQADLGGLLAAYGRSNGQAGYNGCADFDCDGDVDQSDLGSLLARYGQNCP